MNYTENYSFPQWEGSDRVTREDVNRAMTAVDTALKANDDAAAGAQSAAAAAQEAAEACPVVKLTEYTVLTATWSFAVNLSGFDLTQYEELWVHAALRPGTSCYMRLNNDSSDRYRDSTSNHRNYLVELPGYTGARKVYLSFLDDYIIAERRAMSVATYNIPSYMDFSQGPLGLTVDQLASLTFHANGSSFTIGDAVRVYGLKK